LKKLIDLKNLKTLSKHNHGFIREILEVYLTNTPLDVDKLVDAVEEENWEEVRYFAHKLKSSSFTLGFEDGYAVFQKIESIIKDHQDVAAIPSLCKEAVALCDEVTVQVKIALSDYV